MTEESFEKDYVEEVEAKSWGRYQTIVLVLIMAGWAFDGAEIYIFGSTAPYIAHSLNYAASLTAVVLVSFNVGQLISTFLLSWLADVRGRRVAFMASILIYSVASLLTGLSWNLSSLFVFRLLVGVGTGVEWGLGATIASEVLPAKRRGTATSIFNVGFPIGGFLASIVFLFVVVPAPDFNWRYAYFIFAIPAFLTLFMRKKFFGETKRFELSNRSTIKKKLRVSYRELFVNKRMTKNTILGTLVAAPMRWNTLPWLALVELTIIHTRGFTPSLIATYVLANTLSAMVGYAMGGTIADFIGRRRAWFLFFGFVVVGYMLSIFAVSHTLIFLGGAIWGFGWGFSPIEVLILSELYPTRARASGEGFALGVGLAGAIVMSLLWLTWIPVYGYTGAAAILMAPLVIPPIALAVGFRSNTKNVKLEDIEYIKEEELKVI